MNAKISEGTGETKTQRKPIVLFAHKVCIMVQENIFAAVVTLSYCRTTAMAALLLPRRVCN